MTASSALTWAVLAALNLALTALVLGARPRGPVRALVALMVVTNGVFALDQVGREMRWWGPWPADLNWWLFLNIPVFAAFLVLPLFVPRQRLELRRQRIVLRAAAVFVVVNWGLIAINLFAWKDPEINGANDPLFGPTAWIPFLLGVSVGIVLLLQSYLRATDPLQRTQARLILAAYLLKASSHGTGAIGTNASNGYVMPFLLGSARTDLTWFDLTANAVAAVALLLATAAVPVGLAVDRWRSRGEQRPMRPVGGDAFLLGAIAVGVVLGVAEPPMGPEYMVLRPLLLSFAILQYQLVSVDVAGRRGAATVTVLATIGAVFLLTSEIVTGLGVEVGAAIGLSFVLALGVGGLLAWPLVRWMLGPLLTLGEARSRELYRAALAEVVAAGGDRSSSTDVALRALRHRLRISEREHAQFEGEVRTAAGLLGPVLTTGSLFLGKYRIERPLGEGGFSRTLLARDETLGRHVVLKVARWARPEDTRRALREARILAALAHPNIVAVHDAEEVAGEVVLVLEYVAGGSLGARMQNGPMPLDETMSVARDMLAGLEAAHARGVVHRDIKPTNTLLTGQGRAKLADFGIAAPGTTAGTLTGRSFTAHGAGTLRYMAPEQARGLEGDARSDLYSVGVVVYEMLVGRPYLPLDGMAEFEARRAILEEEPPLPLPNVPDTVNQELRRALAKDPAERPAAATEMRRLLTDPVRAADAAR